MNGEEGTAWGGKEGAAERTLCAGRGWQAGARKGACAGSSSISGPSARKLLHLTQFSLESAPLRLLLATGVTAAAARHVHACARPDRLPRVPLPGMPWTLSVGYLLLPLHCRADGRNASKLPSLLNVGVS